MSDDLNNKLKEMREHYKTAKPGYRKFLEAGAKLLKSIPQDDSQQLEISSESE